MGTREIVSLQFGHYSNFIGTHWWNIQETGFGYNGTESSEIDHDVLFREGLTVNGQVTYTPRLLLVDLKGSLGTLSEQGNLYEPLVDPSTADTNWNNKVEVYTSTTEIKNQFQEELYKTKNPREIFKKSFDFDNNVKVWSDFLYSRFHPRTTNIVSEYSHKQSSCFEAFAQGTELWRTQKFLETFSDKIRNYVEECDSFQGFHITLDATDGFSGLSSSCIQYIEEEYEKKPILAFPVIPSHYSDDKGIMSEPHFPNSFRVMNLAFCFDALNEHSSVFVPLCTGSDGWIQPRTKIEFNHVTYDHKLYYHSSAILAAALDTFSLRYRMKTHSYTLKDLCADFTTNSRKVVAASVCLPFSINEDSDFISCLDKWEGPLTKSITPNCSIGTDKLLQMFTLRGIPETRLKNQLSENKAQRHMPAFHCNSINEMLNFYLSCNYFYTLSSVTNVAKGVSVRTPFPHFFDDSVGANGNICATPRKKDLEDIPILAGLHSGSCIGDMIESLHSETKKIKKLDVGQFSKTGIEMQEISDCFDRLLDLTECYEDNYL
ncbi:hypothetical protein RN001_000454 [Aquatica leii]|uniref:Protein misato n=1 Tax=Aquatica leii TaxID=1421715 RepID=A0AAN7PFC3_9COLE|nr:hypothetical protein RN001_000454 [Aquatica leii]